MAFYGYARVSSIDQDLSIQEAALQAAGCDVVRAEKATATRRAGRTELETLLAFLRPGDTLGVFAEFETNLLEPTLARNGYRIKDLAEQFDVKAAEIKALLSGRLDPKRTAELQDRMLAAGLPLGVSA